MRFRHKPLAARRRLTWASLSGRPSGCAFRDRPGVRDRGAITTFLAADRADVELAPAPKSQQCW